MADPAEDTEDHAESALPTTKPNQRIPAPSAPPNSNKQPPSRPDATQTTPTQSPAKRNAFAELMRPKPKPPIAQAPQSMASKASQVIRGVWRGALLEYIEHPERFPGQVLRVTEHTVLIKDAFPKATIHLLLLPRSPAHYLLHPHTAFADPAFLATIQADAASAAQLAAAELARQLGSFSATNRARDEALNHADGGSRSGADLPPGRDYTRDIRVGTHAHPSMAHLHVHIISRDSRSERVRHRKHYNSFNTPFFVPLEDYPLAADDVRRETGFQNGNLNRDLVCWRCGRGFGGRFAELKRHLEEEFEGWRGE